jgi:RHS repeat-associated protein
MVSEAFGKTFVDTTLAPTTTGTTTNNLRFPGQYEDVEAGTYYNYMRTYLPMVGRYGESDPIGLKGGINTFAYVDSRPLTAIDAEGLAWYRSRLPPENINTIICRGEYPDVYLGNPLNSQYQCTAIVGCIKVHENVHRYEAVRSNPSICKGNRGLKQILMDESEAKANELRAYRVELSCLNGIDVCEEPCKSEVPRRRATVERQIRQNSQ